MKTISFWEGVAFALCASISGGIAFFGLSALVGDDCALRLVISGLSVVYIIYLLYRSNERIGRITILLIWLAVLTILWLLYPPISLFLCSHLLAIWLVRSLYFYASLFAALADLCLHAFSLSAAFWACQQAGSLFLSLWCFFLVQALFVVISSRKKTNKQQANIAANTTDFNSAYQAAEAAVRKLSSIH